MPKRTASPPFPDSTGAWIACFRQRARDLDGRPLSPEQFARLINRSGATVRRWESNRAIPDERDIARIAEAACLTPQQIAFLSSACTRMRAMPGPDERDFRAYMTELLTATPNPSMILDGLFHVRAWNGLVDALAPRMVESLKQEIHPLRMMLRSDPRVLFKPVNSGDVLRAGIRIFWMITAVHSHRPEYGALIRSLEPEPRFRELWMELALGDAMAPREPITFAHAIVGGPAAFRVYEKPISFPPTYYIHEYQPDDDFSRRRLSEVAERPQAVHFNQRLHWANTMECELE
jgi:transcriptional regulator with XRE-family HTH domain